MCVHYRQHVHKQPLEEQKELLQAKGILTHLRGKEGKMDRGRTAQHTTTPTLHTNNKMRKEKKPATLQSAWQADPRSSDLGNSADI